MLHQAFPQCEPRHRSEGCFSALSSEPLATRYIRVHAQFVRQTLLRATVPVGLCPFLLRLGQGKGSRHISLQVTSKSLGSHSKDTGPRYARSVSHGLVGFSQKSAGTVSTPDCATAAEETNGEARPRCRWIGNELALQRRRSEPPSRATCGGATRRDPGRRSLRAAGVATFSTRRACSRRLMRNQSAVVW